MRTSRKLVAAVAVGSLGLFAPEAQAGRCDDVAKYASKLKELADKVCEVKDGKWKSCDKLESKAETVAWFAQWWNSMTQGTWAQLGPRSIAFGSRDKGTLLVPGQRIWISNMPVGGDTTSFTLQYEDGKAGLNVNYCAIGADAKVTPLDFEELPKEAKKSPVEKKFTKAQVGGKFIAVEMIGQGALGNKYEYNITLNGEALQLGKLLVGPVKAPGDLSKPVGGVLKGK